MLFPYDPKHQTFLNVYDQGALQAQAILDRDHAAFEYFAGSRQGVLAVARRFVPAGVHHILIGPDHLLFLVGLLLLGGSLRQLALVVTAFTLAHSVTLSLAVLGLVNAPSRLVEPAIALSIVYVGIDNLMVRSGRDLRPWIAFAFGLIHGFGFASVLREMDLPRAPSAGPSSRSTSASRSAMLVVVRRRVRPGAFRARSEARRTAAGRGRARSWSSPPARCGSCNGVFFPRRAVHEDEASSLASCIAIGALSLDGVGLPGAAAGSRRRSSKSRRSRTTCSCSRAAAATPPCSSARTASWSWTPRCPGWGQPILDKIKELTPKPVTTIINTHTHGDHVSGNVEFPATVDVVVQENTKANMEKMGPVLGREPVTSGPNIFSRTAARGCRSGRSRTS